MIPSRPSPASNLGYLCTRAICEAGNAGRVALRRIGADLAREEYTFDELERRSNRAACGLLSLGLAPGDVVFTLLPRVIEQFEVILGALKARLIVGALFSNIGADAIVDRLGHAGARALVTRMRSLRKIQSLRPRLPALSTVLVTDAERGAALPAGCRSWADTTGTVADVFEVSPTPADTPSLLHYTSGSTGKPKGVLHAHGAAPQILATARDVLGILPDDIYWCTAEPGWITGTSYGILGPWMLGATQLHYDGAFEPARWAALLARERVTVWYTAPTALRMLMREEPGLFPAEGLAALRQVSSVGEPLNPEIIEWGRSVLGREIHDTWFQTETGAIMIANRPGIAIRPGSMGKPVGGVEPVIVDDAGAPVPDGETGHLCIRPGWPSMFRAYLHQPDAYASKFRAGLYWTGDRARRDADGYYWFQGRSDDVINTAGHLVSPFEIESALLEIPEVLEAGAVAAPDPLLHEKVVAFVRLRETPADPAALEMKLRLHVQNRVSTLAAPRDIRFVDRIPKNRSGKIMRRVLKAWHLGEDPGDLSTLEEY